MVSINGSVGTRGAAAWGLPRWLTAATALPLTFLLVVAAWPLAVLASQIPASWSAFTAPGLWQVTGTALLQAGLSTFLALLWGIPLAGVLSRYDFHGRHALQALVTVPFVLPTVVVALAFKSLPIGLDNGLTLVLVAHAYINVAIIVRVVGSRWSHLDARQIYAARTLGAHGFRLWFTVTLPHLRSSIATAGAIAFTFCFTSLGIVLFLGDSTTRTLETTILRNTSVILDFPSAVAAAALQFIIVGLVLALAARTSHVTDAPAHTPRLPWSDASGWTRAFTMLSTAMVIAPLAAILIASFSSVNGFTLEWWSELINPSRELPIPGGIHGTVMRSLAVALITACVAAVIGMTAALGALSHATGRVVALLAVLPLGISAVTIGLGTVLAYGRPPLDLRASALLLPLAHSLIAVPLVIAIALPSLRAVDIRTIAVAASLGAPPTRAFMTAYGPLVLRVAFAGAALAAAVSLGEFGAASFLSRADAPTAPVAIGRLLARPGEVAFGVAAALSVVIGLATWLAVSFIERRRP